MGALDGMVVLDLTRLLPGAAATQALASEGAEVVKIEQPGEGDYARTLYPALFAAANGGKKSVALDLKTARGVEALLALAAGADVLVESFRPGAMARLGLGFDTLEARNPRLIFASITGYGQNGPYAALAGHDINYIALGGLLSLQAPVIPGVQIADIAGGAMQAVNRILLALLERHSSGRGCFLDIAMMAGLEPLLAVPLASHRARAPAMEVLSGRFACYTVYPALDGRWVAVGALEPKFWAALCRSLGLERLIASQFDEASQAETKARVAAVFATRRAEEWFELLRDSDCCVTPVRTVAEAAAHFPPAAARPAPALGEHTREILERAGISGRGALH